MGGEILEERLESVVVVLQLRIVGASPGPVAVLTYESVVGSARGVMYVGDVAVRDRDARLLHLRDVPERVRASIPSKPGKPHVPDGVRDRLARGAGTHGWPPVIAGSTYLAPNSAWKPAVAAGLVGQRVGPGVRCCRRTRSRRLRAVDAIPTKSVWGLPSPARWQGSARLRRRRLVPLGRARPEDARHVARRVGGRVLELDVRGADTADVTARSRERHPWGGCRLLPVGDHVRQRVERRRRPDRSST